MLLKFLQSVAPKLGVATTKSMVESILSTNFKNEPLELLELGCGRDSVVFGTKTQVKYTGFEIFEDYAIEIHKKISSSRNPNITYHKIVNEDFLRYNFKEKSYDIVIMIDVLEHLTKSDGHLVLETIESIARKAIIIKTPNGFVHQNEFDGNSHQAHLSGWDEHDFISRSYKVYGMSGLKFLRKSVHCDQWEDDLSLTMRFKPKQFWLLVAGISQLIVKKVPRICYELLAVKTFSKSD
jgi:hypothetical protein